jgi:pimeloyl-ACP methyl ester carboxylesterase
MPLSESQLYYEDHGDGEPLVLIPGFAAGSWIWYRQIGPLSQTFRVITFDPRGIGNSPGGSEPLTICRLVDDIASLLRELKIEHAHILGASFGGFVAQEFSLKYPGMIRALSLCCTSFGGPNHVAPSMETLAAIVSTDGFNTRERIRRNLLPAFSPKYVSDHLEGVEHVIDLRVANTLSEHVYRSQLAAAVGFNTESRVHTIDASTLVLTGDADAVVPMQNSYNLASKIPGAELRTIAGGSHLFFIEQPAEFNRIVTEFLRRQ